MIIPSLLQDQVVSSIDNEKDDMTPEEQATLKRALDALASYEGAGRIELLEETKRRAIEDALAREAARKRVPEVQATRRPPEVMQAAARAVATPISVPSNFGAGPSAGALPRAPEPVAEAEPVAPAPPGAGPGKKMSRFKARQLGLDV